ncbi:MAG: hypothetical protein HOV97_05640 [Nonomuraea sp.]|nr:hypothetical protein [Nonomuraea sp.]
MTQQPLPPALQQILAQTGGQIPQPGQQLNLQINECDCCERFVSTPYQHTDSNGNGWDYCQDCYDAGCPGPFAGGCDLDESFFEDEGLGDCVVCKRVGVPLAMYGVHAWCADCFEKYEAYLKTHPIPPKDRFTPVYRGQKPVLKHQPAYLLPPEEWASIDFKPEYILNPASAPPPTRKKAHIVSQQPTPQLDGGQPGESMEDMMRRIVAEQLGAKAPTEVPNIHMANQPGEDGPFVSLDQALASIDPADSEKAMKLFHWLRDNHRLHKVATLEIQGAEGYMFMYQEPPGSDQEGYTAGATQGDRIVDDALEKAQASGGKPLKGLCRNCLSSIVQIGSNPPEAETPRAGTNPAECPGAGGGRHEFAG